MVTRTRREDSVKKTRTTRRKTLRQTDIVMTAGAVSAPLIIPIIQLQTHRAKNHLDTNTPVSIQSDSPQVQIFFTLDGSRPVAEQRGPAGSRKSNSKSSRKYSGPILLPAGRVAVRAVAVASDGRESSTVTKVFWVDSNTKETDQQHPGGTWSEGALSVQNIADSSLRPSADISELRMGASPQSGPRFLNSRLGSRSKPPQTGSSQSSQSATPGVLQKLSSETSGILRETNSLQCAQCLSLRPSDPFARFCAKCGASVPPVPGQRLPHLEGGQAVHCLSCEALVPVNTKTCLICESPVHQEPQSSLTLQDHVLCICCGSGNPAHISSCLTCESRLQPVSVWNKKPSVQPADGRMLSCSRCERLNRADARYCDWCGCKPGHSTSCVVCWRCGASGHLYALYCAACGAFLEAPPPPTSCSDITRPVRSIATQQALCTTSTQQVTPSSGPDASMKLATPTAEQSTQTVGLYYPSATELQRKEQQRALQLSRKQETRDRRPLLSAISPGRGFWRKQLDHVCSHLRSFAQNNPPFRALLGEPRLGRMVSAVIQEDRLEVSLTVSFVSAGQEEQKVGPSVDGAGPAGRTETLSSVTERSDQNGGLRSGWHTGVMKPSKPPVKDVQLLKELGPGRGEVSIIQQLLDQGADPSCCDSDGRHALVLAVVNGHQDVLPVLVQRGADVNQQSGEMKNTALHEAASQGSGGLDSAQVLLSCRASVRQRNASGQTPYDVAVKSGCSDMLSLLAAQTGLDLLQKLRKPKLSLDGS